MKLNLDNLSLVKPILVVCLVSLLVYLFAFRPSLPSTKLVRDKRIATENPNCQDICQKVSSLNLCDRLSKTGPTNVLVNPKNKGVQILRKQPIGKQINQTCEIQPTDCRRECNQTPPPPSPGPSSSCKQKLQNIQNKYKVKLIVYDNYYGKYYNQFNTWFSTVLENMKSESAKQDFFSCVEDRDFLKNLNVTSLNGAFYRLDFDQYQSKSLDISKWDTSSVTDMSGMLSLAKNIPDISGWDTSSVTKMSNMFNSSDFNGDISGWNVSSVTDMYGMFAQSDFNQDIGGWDVHKVTNMGEMFLSATSFNQDLSGWTLHPNVNYDLMFQDATSMNPNHTPYIPEQHIPIT